MRLSNKTWNQGHLDRNRFAMQRQQATRQLRVDALVERVFELACLAGQPGWLPAKTLRLVYAESGADELGAVWSDRETGEALLGQPALESFWTTTELDPQARRYQAVLATPELAVGTLDVLMAADGEGTTVRFTLSYTVLSERGSALFDEGMDERLGQLLERFGRTLTELTSSGAILPVERAPQQARRQSMEHEIEMRGDVDECFALACPVAELRWIDDWQFDLIYSQSGRNETGCAFLEPVSGLSMLRTAGANTYWYSTRYDAEQHLFEAVWLTRDLTIARWTLRMIDLGGGQVRTHWRLVYTSLGAEGLAIVSEAGFAGRMKGALQFLATSLKTYVETGSLYRIPHTRKVQLAATLIGASLGRHLRRRRGGEPAARAMAD